MAGVALLIAPTEQFKSWAAMYLARSWLTGEDWMGRKVRPVERVWYVSNEKSRDAVLARFFHIFDGLADAILDRLVIEHNSGIVYGNDRMRELYREVQDGPQHSAVILDTHMSLFPPGFSEISSVDGSLVLDAFRNLRARTQTNVLLVGHTPLDDPFRLRGWTGIEGAADDRLILRRTSMDSYGLTLFMRPKDGTPDSSKWVFDPQSLSFVPSTGQQSIATVQAVSEVVTDIWVGQQRAASLADILASDAFKDVAEGTVRNKVTDAVKAKLISEWTKTKNVGTGRMVTTYVPARDSQGRSRPIRKEHDDR